MAFVNLSLLLGGAAVAIPIVLHLVMRQRPKVVEFPAVMFLKARREANRRRLQLRHWILLALRCLAVALLALTLARPSVASALVGNWIMVGLLGILGLGVAAVAVVAKLQKTAWWMPVALAAVAGGLLLSGLVLLGVTLAHDPGVKIGGEEAPVAAVLLVDTSPRMQYRHHNQTRLERAQEMAAWLLTQLPADSDIAIADSNLGAAVFAVDRGAAGTALSALAIDAGSRPVAEVLPQAFDLLAGSERARREIYVFTDLTENAWPEAAGDAVASRLAELKNASIYVIDVGVEQPANFLLGEIALSQEVLPRSGTLEVSTQLLHVGGDTTAVGGDSVGDRVVELEVERFDPTLPIIVDGEPQLPGSDPTKSRRQAASLSPGGSAALSFSITNLEIGTHHGRLRLDRGDNLPMDDVRYFTFEVREPWPVLVLHGLDTSPELFTEAIAPYEFVVTGRARFAPTVAPISQLATRKLGDYAVVALVDPPAIPPAAWQQLGSYVQRGGKLAIFLGHNASKANFNDPAAQELLPGKLDKQWRSGTRPREFSGRADLYLAPRTLAHPSLAAFRDIAANVPWYDFPVFRHWSFEGNRLHDGASVVLRYSNGQPAVVERPLGQGRVLVMTTPVSDAANPPGREPWNWLPTGFEPWPYVMLMNETMLYLAGSGDAQLNYLSGQTATLADASPASDDVAYHLFTPLGGRPQTVRSDDGRLALPFTTAPGAYRLKSLDDDKLLGFSVNLPLEASDLARVAPARLDAVLGKDRYQLARETAEIVREQGEARVGREFFPLLALLLVGVLGVEALLANRFYRAT
jgi:hypothetical protein